jgi:hypothetical protein
VFVNGSVRRFAAAVSALGAVGAIAAGCSTQSQPAPTPTPTPPPKVASQIDARWIGFEKSQPWNWVDVDRQITTDFQQYGFRPVGETELPRGCNGCGTEPATARVTVYAPAKFDPAASRSGQPVSVSGSDAFFRAAQGSEDAMLTWQYADNAWATARGTTTITSNLDRLSELARALRPNDRSPVRLPLSLTNVPATLPLAAIETEPAPYGTILTLSACTNPGSGAAPPCEQKSDHLRVQIWRTDGYYGHIDEQKAVAYKIGGKDGKYDKASHEAAVQVQNGMLVVFELSGPYPDAPITNLENILTSVTWASDPGNDATWQPVTDWTK